MIKNKKIILSHELYLIFFAHLQFIHFIVNKTINTNKRDNHSDNQKHSNFVLILNSVIKVLQLYIISKQPTILYVQSF